jgi:hypothetical protein
VAQAIAASRVISMPVDQLLGEDGQPLALVRSRYLSGDDIRALLRGGGVRFVFANIGSPLAWAEGPELFKIWKTEVQPHLAALDARIRLEDFPDEYAYFASLWTTSDRQDEGPVVLLEMHH